jgi:hypothetical protein
MEHVVMPLPALHTKDVDYMRRQFRAWMEGAEARANQFAKLSENPYVARTAEADAWENGWERIDWGINSTTPVERRVSNQSA